MMNNNGDYHFWGIHMGWWGLILVHVIVIAVLFTRSRKKE